MVDSYCVLSMKYDRNFSLYSGLASSHIISKYIHERGPMLNFFKNFLAGGRSFFGRGHMPTELSAEDIKPLVMTPQFSHEYMSALECCLKKYPSFGFALNRLGVYLHNSGDLEGARLALKKSLIVNPSYNNTIEHLQNIENKTNNISKAPK